MTKREMNKFQKVLEARVTELSQATGRRDGIVIEKCADELENLFGAAQREMAVRSLESGTAKLRETIAALRRIEEGTYGMCPECEEEISSKRLLALPSAALCIRCQEASDSHCATKAGRPALAMAA